MGNGSVISQLKSEPQVMSEIKANGADIESFREAFVATVQSCKRYSKWEHCLHLPTWPVT